MAASAVQRRSASPTIRFPERLLALVRLTRPFSVLWTASSVVVMVLLLSGSSVNGSGLAGCLFAMSTIGAAMRTLNDIADRDNDRLSSELDRNRRPLVTGVVSPRRALAQVLVLAGSGIVVAWTVDPGFGVLMTLGTMGLVLYSVGPAPVAGLPLAQVYWIAFWTTVYFSLYLAIGGSVTRGLAYLVATCLFMGVGETIAKDLRDLENDTQAGRRTTPVWLGWQRATVACVGSYLVGGAVFVVATLTIHPVNARLTIAVATVMFLWALRSLAAMRVMSSAYSKEQARVLHVGSVRVFLVVNLLFLAGLPLAHGS